MSTSPFLANWKLDEDEKKILAAMGEVRFRMGYLQAIQDIRSGKINADSKGICEAELALGKSCERRDILQDKRLPPVPTHEEN